MILFIFLRQKNKVSPFSMLSTRVPKPHFYQVFYEPKVKYVQEQPAWVSTGLLGWASTLLRVKEPEIIDKIGFDAAAFLRFIRTMRTIFFVAAFSSCAILIPIDLWYNLRFVPLSARDNLSILTIRDVRGAYLAAHIAVIYIITATVIVVVRRQWSVMGNLREQYFLSTAYLNSFDPTLTVMRIPKSSRSEEGIRALLDSVDVPYPITDVHIGRRLEDLPRLIKVHNDTVRKFEQKMVPYLKGGKFGEKRPTVRVGGFLGIGGEVRDVIDHYTNEIRKTEQAVMEYRAKVNTHRPENYGFVSFATVSHAHAVAQLLEKKRPRGAKFMLTPNPKDIIWENLSKSRAVLTWRRLVGWLLLIIVMAISPVPLIAISFLANLNATAAFVPFIYDWLQSNPTSFMIIIMVVPSIALKIFMLLLASILRGLSRYQGAVTQSQLQGSLFARYFAFVIIMNLILFTFIGVVFNSITQIIHQTRHHGNLRYILNNIDSMSL
jgi:hypothetical protein